MFSPDVARFRPNVAMCSSNIARFGVDIGRFILDVAKCRVDIGRFTLREAMCSLDIGMYSRNLGSCKPLPCTIGGNAVRIAMLYPHFSHIQGDTIFMIPSKSWFPLALQERAAWYENFAQNIATVGTSLGLTAADLSGVVADNQNIQFLATAAMTLQSYTEAVRQYRIIFTEGNIGNPTPAFPALDPLEVPNPAQPTGAYERLDNLVKRIRVAPAYTPEVGALLGIIPSSPAPIPEPDMKPAIKASDSFGGYKFEVNVTRLGMTAFKVQVQKGSDPAWNDAGFATSNPAVLTITPTTPGQPERIMVRAILLKNNEPVGQPSDPTYVTVNP